jgi:methylenetetrahydrofolate dehydrogenase (NADP+)/methenyltetrahydrofolate cyclohydrolase
MSLLSQFTASEITVIDGKATAAQVLEEVKHDVAALQQQGITPGLAVVWSVKIPQVRSMSAIRSKKP